MREIGTAVIVFGLATVVVAAAVWSPPMMVVGAVVIVLGGVARDWRRSGP